MTDLPSVLVGWTRSRVRAHWEAVLKRPDLPPVSYEFARSALAVLPPADADVVDREPGAD